MDDARQGVVGECLGGVHRQRAFAVDGGGEHLASRRFLDRHGFACDRGLIHAGMSVDHLAVRRDRFARQNNEGVAHPDLLHRNSRFLVAATH